MSDYPVNSTAKIYYDVDGNEVTLRELIKRQPDWAYSRIKVCEELEQESQRLLIALEEAYWQLEKHGIDSQPVTKKLAQNKEKNNG